MSNFADLEIHASRSFQTSSISAGSIEVSNKETTKVVLKLPRPTPIKASFRKESWGDSVVKVFKKELQTGDKEFDDLVYISTSTPDLTAAFLQDPVIRRAVALSVETAGPIEIEGDSMIGHMMGHDHSDDPDLVTIAAALLRG